MAHCDMSQRWRPTGATVYTTAPKGLGDAPGASVARVVMTGSTRRSSRRWTHTSERRAFVDAGGGRPPGVESVESMVCQEDSRLGAATPPDVNFGADLRDIYVPVIENSVAPQRNCQRVLGGQTASDWTVPVQGDANRASRALSHAPHHRSYPVNEMGLTPKRHLARHVFGDAQQSLAPAHRHGMKT